MNKHVPFQVGRRVAGVAALVAIVTFLYIIMKLVHFELAGYLEISLLACAVCTNALESLMKVVLL